MASILKAGRHMAFWSAGVGTAIPLIIPTLLAEDKPAAGPCCQGKIKPSQLPIYDEPEDLYDITYHVSGKGQVQEGVETVRKELVDAMDTTKELRDQIDHIYQTGKAHTAGQIAYLRDEENLPARAGAIAAGGLLGLLLGARGRIVKKLLYSSVGAGGTGAVLYPEYSKQYSQDLWNNANTYGTVAYNFLVGVKPQVNGSGSASQETGAALSPVDSGKSKSLDARGVEVSNPYPSLLTLPYTTLFRKQETLALLPRADKSTKEIRQAGLSDASRDRMAEEASQVSMLGFRLQEAETQVSVAALSGFGSVAPEDTHKCEKCGKRKRKKKKSKDHDASKRGLSSSGIEEFGQSNIPVEESSEKGIMAKIESVSKEASEIIDELKTGSEFVAEVSDEVVVGAETIEKVAKSVEKIASFAPVVGSGVAVASGSVAEEAMLVVGVTSEVEQAAERADVVLGEAEKVAADVETFAEKVSDHKEGSLTAKETAVSTSKKGAVDMVQAAAEEATEVVGVMKTGTEIVAEISNKVEESAEIVEKFSETVEKSENFSPVVGSGAAIVAEEAGLLAGIAGKVDKAAENTEKVLDSVAGVAEKVETLAETVLNLKKPASSAVGKEDEHQSASTDRPSSLFDKLAAFFSPEKATEADPLKSVDSPQTELLKSDPNSHEVGIDSEVMPPPEEHIAASDSTKCLESKFVTLPDNDESVATPLDQKEASPLGQKVDDQHSTELGLLDDVKPEVILSAEIVNTDTNIGPDERKTRNTFTSSTEKTVVADTSLEITLDDKKLIDQSGIDSKMSTQKGDAKDGSITSEEFQKLPEKKSLFSRLAGLFSSNELETVQQKDALAFETEPATVETLTNLAEKVIKEPVLPETVAQDAALPETIAEDAALPETVAQDAALPETIAKDAVLPETVAQDAVLPETVAQDAALPETVAQDAALPETVAQDAALPETIAQESVISGTVVKEEAAFPETVTQQPAPPPTDTVIKESESPLVEVTTPHKDEAAAVLPEPAVTITKSEQDVIVSSEASSIVFPTEADVAASDPVKVGPVVRQLDRYMIIEAPGTQEDIADTLEEELKSLNSAAGASVSSKPGLYSRAGESSKSNLVTSNETKKPLSGPAAPLGKTILATGTSPSAKTVSQSTLSDTKSKVNDTSKGAPQPTEKTKDVVVRAKVEGGVTKPEGDHGQSNPEDDDMYTTRS